MRKHLDIEHRSKTTSITMRPSIFEKLQKIATINGSSISSILNCFAEKYVIEHQSDIEAYDKYYTQQH